LFRVVVLLLGLAFSSLGLTQSPNTGDVAQLLIKARADSNDPLAHYALAIVYHTLAPSRYPSRVFDARWRLTQSP
jgi:hypothetical protein